MFEEPRKEVTKMHSQQKELMMATQKIFKVVWTGDVYGS